jgi:hypothetical protein
VIRNISDNFISTLAIWAFRTLLVVFILTLTCLLNSRPVLDDYVSDGKVMIKIGSKIDPATLKPPVFSKPPHFTNSAPVPTEAEKGVKGVDFTHVTNPYFIKAVFHHLPDGAFPAVCSKSGDPTDGRGWPAYRADSGTELPNDNNNYFNCSSFRLSEDGQLNVRKAQLAGYHCLLFDDQGTKAPRDLPYGVVPSWKIETSPGNFQGGIILATPITDVGDAEQLQRALLSAGLGDEGASGLSRWARLPNAINGKAKHQIDGKPFQCRLVEWHPDKRYTVDEIVSGLKLELTANKEIRPVSVNNDVTHDGDDVFTPRALENPVVAAIKARGLYKTPLGSGKHDVTCPWVLEHTDTLDTGAAYFEPDENYPVGGFCCQHSHRDKYKTREFLGYLNIDHFVAMNKPAIRIVQGDLHRVVDAAERELAQRNRHFQYGGLIVSIATDANTGDPSIVPTNKQALTRELSVTASWERYDRRSNDWMRCDPPARHISILYDSQSFRYLPSLAGLARQPYFRESDGELVTESGYDKKSKMFGVFDPRQFEIPEPTQEAAQEALGFLKDLLLEFRFVSNADKSAALSAIITAVVRPTLPQAPAFHVKAPASGSGKTYMCELIGAFAGPGGNAKVSYPKTSEEATKVLLSLLLTSPAVIEFDDMDGDWAPHGTINRVLTSEHITDRILGVSKMATVSTRTLFLGSGNNVGPVRDLLRRVLTINIDPRCATPATITYKGSPVSGVHQQRGRYVAAVLTIIRAWRKAGSPRADVDSIATYGGAWAEYCRHPLIWLGLPDPATTLLEQVKHDPDADSLGNLMVEWKRVFGSSPTTVRKAVTARDDDFLDALREFPVEEKGFINRSKLGWILKKNANRIVGGLEFQRAEADGRTAWRVVEAGARTS